MELHVHLAHFGVFYCGQQLSSQLVFRSPTHSSRVSNSIAWATVQLQCQRMLSSENALAVAESNSIRKGSSVNTQKFSLDDRETSNLIFSSPPSVLFCDLTLVPNEKALFSFNLASIPSSLPPTFKGRSVRIAYHLTIAYQRLNEHVKTIRIPIRILALQQFYIEKQLGLSRRRTSYNDQAIRAVHPNPFVRDRDDDDKGGDHYDDHFQDIYNDEGMSPSRGRSSDTDQPHQLTPIGRRRARVYDVVHASLGKVAKLCLLKSEFKLGEELIFILDATEAEVECVQFAASAILIEKVLRNDSNKNNKEGENGSAQTEAITRIRYAKTAQFCLGTQISHASLELPLHAVSSFKDNVMDLSWYLEFEFVLAMEPVLYVSKEATKESNDSDFSDAIQEWNGPDKLGVQTLKWETEIKVHPPSDRVQVAQWVHAEADLYFQL